MRRLENSDGVEALEQLVDDAGGLAAASAAQACDQLQVLAGGEVRVERGELPGEGDRLADLLPLVTRRRSR